MNISNHETNLENHIEKEKNKLSHPLSLCVLFVYLLIYFVQYKNPDSTKREVSNVLSRYADLRPQSSPFGKLSFCYNTIFPLLLG